MNLKTSFSILLILISQIAQAQMRNDSLRSNHLIVYQFGYLNCPVAKTFDAKGCFSTVGFNAGWFFSKKIVFGIVADFKLISGKGVIRTSNNFRNDFYDNFILPQNSQLDSVNAETVLTNISNNGFKGNTMGYYGLMFSLFPNRAGGIMFQVKRGKVSPMARQNIFYNTYIGDGQYGKFGLDIPVGWRFDITLKPRAFFHDTYVGDATDLIADVMNSFTLTFYYDRINFAGAGFNGTKFSSFMTSTFMSKYAIDNRFGLKIGFSFY